MAKKRKPTPKTEAAGAPKFNKSAAILVYLKANKGAMPKVIVAALKDRCIDVSPKMVSIIRVKSMVRRAVREAGAAKSSNSSNAGANLTQANGLDAVLTLYTPAQGQETSSVKIKAAFLKLVDFMS